VIAGLAGKDAWEQAKVDEFVDFHKDVANEIGPYIRVACGFMPGDKVGMSRGSFSTCPTLTLMIACRRS